MMRLIKEETSFSEQVHEQACDLISAVKELHGVSSQEFNKLLRDSENFTIQFQNATGTTMKIDVEKLAGSLPLHLIAVLMSSARDESLLRYLLCGIRLLHSLCDLAPRQSKLEQILLDDFKVSEQLLDLIFYGLIVLSAYRQENHYFSSASVVHSSLVACSLYLLIGCISSHWQDLAQVLLAHPKVDLFMDAAFGAVHVSVQSLQVKLSARNSDLHTRTSPTAEKMVNYHCQQCEASLQFLQSLCQQKIFRERLLRNKELCGKGGVLSLAQTILKLNISPFLMESSTVFPAVSRLKSKVLSILLHLCEAESTSYLDEVARSPQTFDLAKSVALEVLDLLKSGLGKDPHFSACSERNVPTGLLRLNAMRLADIFSDDSNFRSYITTSFTKVLTAIFSLPCEDFASIWCSSEFLPREVDATLEYDAFAAAGWALDTLSSSNLSNATKLEITLIPSNMLQTTYTHQRTSLFVKVIANLHCFVPNICEEQERNFFLHKFLECMQLDPSQSLPGFCFTSGAPKAVTVCRNVCSLLSHAESLIPNFLNEEDVQLLRVFFNQLQSMISPTEYAEQDQEIKFEKSASLDKFSKLNINENFQEAQSIGRGSSPVLGKTPSSFGNRIVNQKEEISENTSFQDEEQLNIRHDIMNLREIGMRENKYKPGMSTPSFFRDVNRDVQNVEMSCSDTSSTRGKRFVGQMVDGELFKSNKDVKESGLTGVQENERVETVQLEEKQPRKRKRTIMNDYQMSLIENALLDEPEMQRNAAALQSWADKLSHYGSEVTSSQLKNWLNNRKARLARAGKDARTPMEIANANSQKQGGLALRQSHDSSESPGEDNDPSSRHRHSTPTTGASENAEASLAQPGGHSAAESGQFKTGQNVMLLGEKGEEIGLGKVYQTQGKWQGKSLEETKTYVVDVTELKADRGMGLPYPSETTGSSFSEAESKVGRMRVLWDSKKLLRLLH